MPLPVETERLVIRPFSWADLHVLHGTIRSDPEVMRFIPRPVAQGIGETAISLREWMEHQQRDGLAPWAVLERASGDFIVALIFPENTASIHVAEKLGMRFDGVGQYYGCEMRRYVLRLRNAPLCRSQDGLASAEEAQ